MRNMSKEFAAIKLKRFRVFSRTCNSILAVKWKYKKDIYLLSTKHNKIEMIKIDKKKWKNNNPNKTVTKPKVVLDYNDSTGGIYLQDIVTYLLFQWWENMLKVIKKYFSI